MEGSIPFIEGPGEYRINVAGESFYPESFAALVGPRREDAVDIRTMARVSLQDDNPHDKLAVSVSIDGYQVGHLPRKAARAFRRTVRYGRLSEYETFECAAMICGGWNKGGGDAGNYGVRLDLELDDM